jgi:opacity protein-like surface antigen
MAVMTHRIACVIVLAAVSVIQANAQSTTSSQPQSANAAADFPEQPSPEQRGGPGAYVSASFGLSATSDVTAPIGEVDAGFLVSKHVSIFGSYGFVRNLRPSTRQAYVDIAVAQIARRQISVTGEAREPAQYAWGGLRLDVPTAWHASPYLMAGAGWVRSAPSAQFTYSAGSATVSGGSAVAGQDATADVLSTGVFVGDGWSAPMFRLAAGLSIPIRRAWGLEARYSWSRVFASDPVTAQGLTVGFTYRF